ncbi:uncharacterized protein LOC121946237 isoform X2 [Plectropomus leopardus]|uniref:uncharacterized protein LOC121946237 isoform X2 n=1 Tax=Plectropomus leopardus TaxID=160734 RepID=UPI001C4B10B5|nr:uncharacterized protein LOC121946237 isoform X2 [Plectropomus leopardus]
MSVTMSKADGVTVFTVTSDSKSVCPPMCGILRDLCYSPACCSVSQRLRRVQRSSQSILGALHFMVGLLNIGLGVILCCNYGTAWWHMTRTLFPLWFGGVFMLFGVVGILSDKFPSVCLVILNVILNLIGVAVAIAAIVLYSCNLSNTRVWLSCFNDYYYGRRYITTPSTRKWSMLEKCLEGRKLIMMLLTGMNAVLIFLSFLELCLVISSAVMSIKALRSREKEENKIGEPENLPEPLPEVTSHPVS